MSEWQWEFDQRGFIRHVVNPKGRTLLMSPAAGPWDGLNDGKSGGIGGFGVHVARSLAQADHRHLDSCHWHYDAGRDQYGVHYADDGLLPSGRRWYRVILGDAHAALIQVNYRWRIRDNVASCLARVHIRPSANGVYFKEPKFCVNGLIGFNDRYQALSPDMKTSVMGPLRATNPKDTTKQIRQLWRRHVRLFGDAGIATISYGGMSGTSVVDTGLKAWRDYADKQPGLKKEDEGVGCYCDNLRATWELVRWPGSIGFLGNSWVGGPGQHICWCAGRHAPLNAKFNVWLRVKFEA